MKPLIIIPGWNSDIVSFNSLANILATQLNRPRDTIKIINYITLDDNITLDDLSTSLDRVWDQNKLSREHQSVDVICHSLGALVFRHWLSKMFLSEQVPVEHLVMLAPANFGSHLAHKGQTLIGRVVTNPNPENKFLQVGKMLLKDLELASPTTWSLAVNDLFYHDEISDLTYYHPDNILTTVLIGNTGFEGIQSAANEVGSDGVVQNSCANLNSSFLEINYLKDPLNPEYTLTPSKSVTAYGIIPDENHSTIIYPNNNPYTLKCISYGLQVTKDNFSAWVDLLNSQNSKLISNSKLQNTVIRVETQYQQGVEDYFLEFYNFNSSYTNLLDTLFNSKIIYSVHPYSDDSSYKAYYIDIELLDNNLTSIHSLDPEKYSTMEVEVSIAATPDLTTDGYVGYTTKQLGSIKIPLNKIDTIFAPDRTLLVKIILPRKQSDQLLTIQ